MTACTAIGDDPVHGTFAVLRQRMLAGDQHWALQARYALVDLPRLPFAEPSPAPIKYRLWRSGLIDSPELRLPMTSVSNGLAARIDCEIPRREAPHVPPDASSGLS